MGGREMLHLNGRQNFVSGLTLNGTPIPAVAAGREVLRSLRLMLEETRSNEHGYVC